MDGLETMVRARLDDDPHDVGLAGKISAGIRSARHNPLDRAMASALDSKLPKDPGRALAEAAIHVSAEAGVDTLTAFRALVSEPAFSGVVRKLINSAETKNGQTT